MTYTRLGTHAVHVRLLAPLALVFAVLAVAGCGESSGEPDGPTVANRVSHEFGHKPQTAEDRAPLEGHETMMRLVQEYNDVGTGQSGKSVESIDGHRMDTEKGTTTWASFVNGIETDPWPSEYKLFPGDVVQWDLRHWNLVLPVRAIVGAFPEFFTRGFNGERIPMRVLCSDDRSTACRHVRKVLRTAGVRLGARRQPPDPDEIAYSGRVLVGPWKDWRERLWPKRVDRGPRYSGIYARFSPSGDELRILDWNGHFVRAERGDVGLVGAMRPTEADFMWLVTGTSEKGVERAARALDSDRLRNAFALAVLPRGDEKIPVEPPR